MIVLVIAGVLFAGYGTAYVASDDVRYLTRAGLETIRILEHRRAIGDLIRDPATDPATRSLLQVVLEARDFAATLGYDARKTYTTYADVGRDTLLLVLSAAPRNCLCPHLWKYPIVGRIPYKGFFDPAAAEREAARFEARGYDVYLRPAGAFASLGWWNDPLYSTAMSRDSVELVATVLHEIAHNTLYVKSATPFNESFAQFAGYRGAEAFFRARGDTAAARRAAERWLDEVVLSGYYRELARRLDSLYRSAPDAARLEAGRLELGRWAREELEGPVGTRLRTYQVGPLADRPVNNARLIAAQIYRTRLDLFEAWYERHGRDIARAVRELEHVIDGSEGDEAFQRLERSLAGSPGVEAAGPEGGS
ncbi:MAG TPA: aminopeptidase [Gemmatimonadales bacterium]|nr:aminopeptidase [Gemmatimonadales bacterium]